MEQYAIYHSALAIHIVGITIAAGATFIDFMLFKQFWKALSKDKKQSTTYENLLKGLQRLTGAGMLLIILSGIGMMAYMHRIWGEQTWFRIKMVTLLLIIINGVVFRMRLNKKMDKQLIKVSSEDNAQGRLLTVKNNITISQVIQILLFITIFILSAFKFN